MPIKIRAFKLFLVAMAGKIFALQRGASSAGRPGRACAEDGTLLRTKSTQSCKDEAYKEVRCVASATPGLSPAVADEPSAASLSALTIATIKIKLL